MWKKQGLKRFKEPNDEYKIQTTKNRNGERYFKYY